MVTLLKPFRFLLVVLVLSCVVIAWARANTPAQRQAHREIQAVYNRITQGMLRKDIASTADIFTPDFRDYLLDGRVLSAQQSQADAQGALSQIKRMTRANVKILSLT